MKSLTLLILAAFAYSLSPFLLKADEAPSSPKSADLIALEAADEARIQAMGHPTREALEAIFSDDLHYTHASGIVDTKQSMIDNLLSGKLKYLETVSESREFSIPASDIALMYGRVKLKVELGEKGIVDLRLSYLAVWKRDGQNWKFLAWQSARLPDTTPEGK